jgi:hypothetical protein
LKKIHLLLLGALSGITLLIVAAVSGNPAASKNVDATELVAGDSLRTLAKKINTIRNFAVKIPDTVIFAGEEMPLNDFEVNERLDRELTINGYWHSSTIQNLKLANRYFPVIEKILKENGVPDDFKFLAVAESGLRNVVSPSDAQGIWQFLEGTAKGYGLQVNSEIDERYQIEKSTEAAAKYFKDAYAKFGNWTLAAASYNAGMGAIESAVDYQKEVNYYDLYLKDETSRYVFRAAAFKIIFENTKKYGFFLDQQDLYNPLEYKIIKVDTTISNLADFASSHKTNYKMLRYYNPWLRSTSLTVKAGQSYEIKLPMDAEVNSSGSK